jgi:hypothetical protein
MSVDGVDTATSSVKSGPVLAALLVGAVGLGVYWWSRPQEPVAPGSTADSPASLSALSGEGAGFRAGPPSAPVVALADAPQPPPARNDPNAEPHEAPPSKPVEFPVYDASASPPVESGPAETAGADPANQRAATLRATGEQAGGAAELALLIESLRTDPLARNRLLAISGLRRLAADESLQPQVLDALRAAQSDRDTNVARNARDAYAEFAGP